MSNRTKFRHALDALAIAMEELVEAWDQDAWEESQEAADVDWPFDRDLSEAALHVAAAVEAL